MIFRLVLILLAYSASAFSSIISFEAGTKMKASEINHNFSEIKTILDDKNSDFSFNIFIPGDVILQESLEQEFSKLRSLGIEVTPLQSQVIKASEINQAFLQMFQGALLYDDLPLSYDISFSVNEDMPYSGSFSFLNKVGATTVEISTTPSHGTVVKNGNLFTYTPSSNYFGVDSFSYHIFDGTTNSNSSTVSVVVNSVNDVPVALPQSLTTLEDSAKEIFLSASDNDGDVLSYSFTQPSHGVISGVAPNLVYTPDLNYSGTDSFSYKVNDSVVDSLPVTINLTVTAVNDPPLISGNNFSVAQNSGTYNGAFTVTDVDNSSFTYTTITSPTKGSLTLNSNGTFSYIPSLNTFGADSFQVKANDGNTNSNTLTISITITGNGIVVSGGSRTYFDGSRANSCYQYKHYSSGNYSYTGSGANGTGYYNITLENGTAQTVYCDMDTDGGGWTLVMRQVSGGAVLATTASISLGSLHTRGVNAKMTDASIRNLAAVGMKEAQIVYSNSYKYIFRYTASAWTGYSTVGWTNTPHDAKNTSGSWVGSACNGHVNNSSFSTWSDWHNARCPTYYQTGVFYYTPYHYSSYANVSNPAPIDIYVR